MNFNFKNQVFDIRQRRSCSNCGHVAETVPFEGRELCDSCVRPMTLQRVKTSLAWEETTAVCVNGQYEFKGWYGDGLLALPLIASGKWAFFKELDSVRGREDFDGMAQELQEQHHALGITEQDEAAYRSLQYVPNLDAPVRPPHCGCDHLMMVFGCPHEAPPKQYTEEEMLEMAEMERMEDEQDWEHRNWVERCEEEYT